MTRCQEWPLGTERRGAPQGEIRIVLRVDDLDRAGIQLALVDHRFDQAGADEADVHLIVHDLPDDFVL